LGAKEKKLGMTSSYHLFSWMRFENNVNLGYTFKVHLLEKWHHLVSPIHYSAIRGVRVWLRVSLNTFSIKV